jgi:hypothetical protein
MADDDKLYPKHHPWELEPHYSRHVSAMTSEALHSKADIAIQLAWRDQEIERLQRELTEFRQEALHPFAKAAVDLNEHYGEPLKRALSDAMSLAAPKGLPDITCPHCGDKYESSEVEYDGDERDMACDGCGAEFDITAHVAITFTCVLRKLKAPSP